MEYEFYVLSMFFKILNISNFNISNIIEIFSMFYFCRSLTSLDLFNFDISKVTDMRNMFYYCHSLTSLDLSNFNIENVIHIKNIFYSINKDCKIITE